MSDEEKKQPQRPVAPENDNTTAGGEPPRIQSEMRNSNNIKKG